jgi:hypothetical protein
MQRTLYFKFCMYDSVPLNPNDTSYSFFTESDSQDATVTGMTEDVAIKWLISNPRFRNTFISDFFDQPGTIKEFYGLQRPFTNPNKVPGDIDVLLADPFQPQYSIAFECKRVKAISTDTGSKVNNVQAIKKCVRQANAYRELGFHQTYLTIILLDDGRAMTTPNTMFSTVIVRQSNAYTVSLGRSLCTRILELFTLKLIKQQVKVSS